MTGPALIDLMKRETQVREGPVAPSLAGVTVQPGRHLLHGDEFLLREPGLSIHYRQGTGVTVERGPGVDRGDEALFLDGTVYAAIACINGLMPLHASAVVVNDRVVAFTGPSGAGKSTVVAGLTRLGFPMFCDDTLVIHVGTDGATTCLPGHKRMKLWPDAVHLTGSPALEEVSPHYPKLYVSAKGGAVSTSLPLGALVFLEDGGENSTPQLVPLTGGEKIARLEDDHYTRALFDSATRHTRPERFALQAKIAGQVRMARFIRPLDKGQFWQSTRYLAEKISDMSST